MRRCQLLSVLTSVAFCISLAWGAETTFLGLEFGSVERENRNLAILDNVLGRFTVNGQPLLRIEVISGAPAASRCNEVTEYGTLIEDSTAGGPDLYVCTPLGWARSPLGDMAGSSWKFDASAVVANILIAGSTTVSDLTLDGPGGGTVPITQTVASTATITGKVVVTDDFTVGEQTVLTDLQSKNLTITDTSGGFPFSPAVLTEDPDRTGLFIAGSMRASSRIVADGGIEVNNNVLPGSGLQHQTVTTGSIPAGGAAVTLTWAIAMLTTSTTVCTVVDATASTSALRVHHIQSNTTTTTVVRVANDSGGNITGTLHCIRMD